MNVEFESQGDVAVCASPGIVREASWLQLTMERASS